MSSPVAPSSNPSRWLGLGCLFLFLSPFFLVGLGATVAVAVSLLNGRWGDAAGGAVFAVMFTVIPGIVLWGALKARRGAVEAGDAGVAEPWLARPEWAAGRIEHSARAEATAAWGFTVVWNAVAVPAGVMAGRELLRGGEPMLLVALLFPVIGAVLLVTAIRATLRAARYGVTVYELAHVPGVVGRGIGGLVRTSADVEAPEGVRARLQCVRRVVTGSGKNRSTRQEVLWERAHQVTAFEPDADGEGVMFPVVFPLPGDVRPTDERDPRDRILWRLRLDAETPGVDFAATFEVPVFVTEASARAPDGAQEASAAAPAPRGPGPRSRVRVVERGAATEVQVPPARYPGTAGVISAVAIAILGILVAVTIADGPLVAILVLSVFAVLLGGLAVSLWTRTSRIVVREGIVERVTGWLTPTSTEVLPADTITEVVVRPGLQAGSTQWYDVVAVTADGRGRPLAWYVEPRTEAEWIAGLVRERAGVGV